MSCAGCARTTADCSPPPLGAAGGAAVRVRACVCAFHRCSSREEFVEKFGTLETASQLEMLQELIKASGCLNCASLSLLQKKIRDRLPDYHRDPLLCGWSAMLLRARPCLCQTGSQLTRMPSALCPPPQTTKLNLGLVGGASSRSRTCAAG